MKPKIELEVLHYSAFFISVAISIYLLVLPDFYEILKGLNSIGYTGAFIAGIFFTSMFTTLPATVSLFILGSYLNPLLMAPIAAVGATLADFLLFSLIKYKLSHHYGIIDRLFLWLRTRKSVRYIKKHNMLKYLIPILGGLIIASPLPDEFGIAFFGASKYNTKHFFILAFFMNMLGIAAIGYFGSVAQI